jgi:hypothetical protein
MGPQQCGANGFTQSGDLAIDLQTQALEHDLPRQGIAVGVEPHGRQCEQDITLHEVLAVHELRPLDGADDEAGHVVLAIGIETGHLRGFAAEQRAAVLAAGGGEARHDLLGHVRRETSGGQVVEEEERRGPLHENIVHAVVHEIAADRVVHAGHERDFQLRADTIGARDEHRIGPPPGRHREQPAERADLGQHTRCERAPRDRFDPADGFVASVDVDPRRLVARTAHATGSA